MDAATTQAIEQVRESCEKRFDHLDNEASDIKKLLIGDGRTPGLADDIRDLKAFKKKTIGSLVFVVGAVVVQAVEWVRSRV